MSKKTEVKPWYKSKTIILNLIGAALAAAVGAFMEGMAGPAIMIAAVNAVNVYLRTITEHPVKKGDDSGCVDCSFLLSSIGTFLGVVVLIFALSGCGGTFDLGKFLKAGGAILTGIGTMADGASTAVGGSCEALRAAGMGDSDYQKCLEARSIVAKVGDKIPATGGTVTTASGSVRVMSLAPRSLIGAPCPIGGNIGFKTTAEAPPGEARDSTPVPITSEAPSPAPK